MSDVYNAEFFEIRHYTENGIASKYNTLPIAQFIMQVFNPSTILDIGCATGNLEYGFWLYDTNINIKGFDISNYAIEHCIPEVKDNLFILDLEHETIPYPENFFDLVIGIDFLEHIHEEFINYAISEITRVCNKYIFLRQPFCRFRFTLENLHNEIMEYNNLTNIQRLEMINNHPLVYTTDPDPACPYHPSERDRYYFIQKFEQYNFHNIYLDEQYYKFPNCLSMCSWNTLVLENNENRNRFR